MTIPSIVTCEDRELAQWEHTLQQAGFRRVQKTDPKTLQPGEYLKQASGDPRSFDGPRSWVLMHG